MDRGTYERLYGLRRPLFVATIILLGFFLASIRRRLTS